MIRFNNDYNRGAFDCILKALADTNTTSYPGYGEDEWCDKAEQIIKGLIGRDDSMIKFIPGATQANYVVVAAALSPVQSVIGHRKTSRKVSAILPSTHLTAAALHTQKSWRKFAVGLAVIRRLRAR